eukprot:6077-Eustigmatos_ZCMA.PRE.1
MLLQQNIRFCSCCHNSAAQIPRHNSAAQINGVNSNGGGDRASVSSSALCFPLQSPNNAMWLCS